MADIHIDGKSVGKTPLEQSILIGTHKVTVSKDGYQSQEKAITISEGKTEELNITLSEKKTSSYSSSYSSSSNKSSYSSSSSSSGSKYCLISYSANSLDARVYVNGSYKGYAGRSYPLNYGDNYVVILSNGYYYGRTFHISKSSSAVLNMSGAPRVGSIYREYSSSSNSSYKPSKNYSSSVYGTKKKSRSGWNSFNVGVYADMAMITYDDSYFGMGFGVNWRLFKYNSVLIPTIGARYMYGIYGSHTIGIPIILNLNWWKIVDDSVSVYFGFGVEPMYLKNSMYSDWYDSSIWCTNLVFNLMGFGWRHHDVNMYLNYPVGLEDLALGLRYSYFF